MISIPRLTEQNAVLFSAAEFTMDQSMLGSRDVTKSAPFRGDLCQADIGSAISFQDDEVLEIPRGDAEVMGFTVLINNEPLAVPVTNEADRVMRSTPMGGDLVVFHSTNVPFALGADTKSFYGGDTQIAAKLAEEGLDVVLNLRTVVGYHPDMATLSTFVGIDINPRNIVAMKGTEKVDTPEFVMEWVKGASDTGVLMRFNRMPGDGSSDTEAGV